VKPLRPKRRCDFHGARNTTYSTQEICSEKREKTIKWMPDVQDSLVFRAPDWLFKNRFCLLDSQTAHAGPI